MKPILFNTDMVMAILDGRKTATRRKISIDIVNNCDMDTIKPVKLCRYQIGDILYVRETWGEWTDGYIYKAWNEPFPQAGCYPQTKWHPSIHMPKEAARIFLMVTDVRVERLQDITEEQAKKEGIRGYSKDGKEAFSYLWNSTIDKKQIDKYGWDANPWVWVIEFKQYNKPGNKQKKEINKKMKAIEFTRLVVEMIQYEKETFQEYIENENWDELENEIYERIVQSE